VLEEISNNWYCAAEAFIPDAAENHLCSIGLLASEEQGYCVSSCNSNHRKWTTPEQFREEYGVDYPDNGAVYVFLHGEKKWAVYEYVVAKRFNEKVEPVVCACTPWGCPPDDWRPE